MNNTGSPNQTFRRVQLIALAIGLIAAVLCVLGAVLNLERFMQSYLVAYLFWVSMALGGLGILMLDYLASGIWGLPIQRPLEAVARTLPLLAILFLPLLLDLPGLYPWAQADAAADPAIAHKAAYLNVPFFIIRAALYFAVWIVLALVLTRWAARRDRRPDNALDARLQSLSAVGLVLAGLTTTFAFVDWGMSLAPHWSSSIYGMMLGIGALLSGMAFATLVVTLLARRPPLAGVTTPRVLNDLDALLLSFVMAYAYMAFMQYLIAWMGNLAEEIPWYVRRLNNGWQWVAAALVVFGFAVPFFLLMSRSIKRNILALLVLSALLLVMRLVDVFWLVIPAFRESLQIVWTDLVTPLALGGIWLAVFLWQLAARPLVPANDPRVQRIVSEAEAHHGELDRAHPVGSQYGH
jgi:hypothetical protein